MNKRFSPVFLISVFLTAMTVLGIAAVPAAIFRQDDELLYQTAQKRQWETGRLTSEGARLYLVRTLYSRMLQMKSGGHGYEEKEIPEEKAAEVKLLAYEALNAMDQNHILPPELIGELEEIALSEGGLTGYFTDSAEFIQLTFGGDELINSFGLELEPRTGLIVNLWINTSDTVLKIGGDFDFSASLDSYKTLLELDILDDWIPSGGSYYDYQQISQKGLCQLYLRTSGKMLHMGITSLPSDATMEHFGGVVLEDS